MTQIQRAYTVLDNTIVRAAHDLSVAEKRVIYVTLSMIDTRKPINPDLWYSVPLDGYAILSGMSRNEDVFDVVFDCTKKIHERSVVLTVTEERVVLGHWTSEVKVDKKDKRIFLRFSSSIIPFLSELTTRYTKIYNAELFLLTSMYSIRLFELLELERFKGKYDAELKSVKGTLDIKLSTLLDYFSVPAFCQNFKYFNSRILQPAIKELQDRRLAKITVKQRKEGKRIIGIIFEYILAEKTFLQEELSSVLGKREELNKLIKGVELSEEEKASLK